MDMQELVSAVVREVLEKMRESKDKPCVLVLGPRDENIAVRVRESLEEEADVLFLGESAGGRTPARHILPFLSCSDMADLALGRASGPVMEEALRLMLSGKVVETLEFGYKAHTETAPVPLFLLYESYEKTLDSFGLTAFRQKKPGEVRLRARLVTAEDVKRAQASGAPVLAVPTSSIVTPLAAETARDLNIFLKRL